MCNILHGGVLVVLLAGSLQASGQPPVVETDNPMHDRTPDPGTPTKRQKGATFAQVSTDDGDGAPGLPAKSNRGPKALAIGGGVAMVAGAFLLTAAIILGKHRYGKGKQDYDKWQGLWNTYYEGTPSDDQKVLLRQQMKELNSKNPLPWLGTRKWNANLESLFLYFAIPAGIATVGGLAGLTIGGTLLLSKDSDVAGKIHAT